MTAVDYFSTKDVSIRWLAVHLNQCIVNPYHFTKALAVESFFCGASEQVVF